MSETPAFPDAKFRCILADPPWPESGGGKVKRGADKHYGLMKVKDIMALPVRDLIHEEGAHLLLWVTNNYLHDGLHVMDAWGFRYVTTITWAKAGRQGLGQYFRGLSEHCLFGVSKGKIPPYRVVDGKRAQGTTLLGRGLIPRPGGHSQKPDELHRVAELVCHEPRMELFARVERENWTTWGNAVEERGEKQLCL